MWHSEGLAVPNLYHLLYDKIDGLFWRMRRAEVFRLEREAPQKFGGTLWDRLAGLGYLLRRCRGTTVLDIGSCAGFIGYEFALRGSRLIHGFELDRERVAYSRRLFERVSVESQFVEADLAVPRRQFLEEHAKTLLPNYDIVLFLGVLHHLKRQMQPHDLMDLVQEFVDRTGRFFAVRSAAYAEIEPWILSRGFRLVSARARWNCGPLRIYERITGPTSKVSVSNE